MQQIYGVLRNLVDVVKSYSEGYTETTDYFYFEVKDAEEVLNKIDIKTSVEDLETKIISWANERNLIAPTNAHNQILKTLEELGETARSLLKGDKEGIKDGIGDVLVTLAIFAATQGLDLQTCLAAAWEEIKDRQGKTENGIFIKQ